MDNHHFTSGSVVSGHNDAYTYSAPLSGMQIDSDTHLSNMGWSHDPTGNSNDQNGQDSDQAHFPPWDGGPFVWDDKHDDFCYVCGSSMQLFQCQTCSTSYHASCMSPTVSPSEVPDFWFCPHCVDRELHIPQPLSTTDFNAPPASTTPGISPADTQDRNTSTAQAAPPEPSNHKGISDVKDISDTQERTSTEAPRSRPNIEILAPPSIAVPLTDKAAQQNPKSTAAKGNTGRQRRSYSPPRKKSKYSAFSSEVDKALTVIHKELEASARVGKTEAELRDKIRMLEQELRLKDGQITLAARELELVKRNGGDSAGLRDENEELKMRVERLERLVEGKDNELRDWRERLKSMIGD